MSDLQDNKNLDYLPIPRLILYDRELFLSQKIVLSALYYSVTKFNKKAKSIEDKLNEGAYISISTLKHLTSLSSRQIKKSLDYLKKNKIIRESEFIKTLNGHCNLHVSFNTLSSKIDIYEIDNLKKADEHYGYLPMYYSVMYSEELNLTEKFVFLMAIDSAKTNTLFNPDSERLAQILNLDTRTVTNAVEHLKRMKLLIYNESNKTTSANLEEFKNISLSSFNLSAKITQSVKNNKSRDEYDINIPKEILEYPKFTLSQKVVLSVLYQFLKKTNPIKITIKELSDYTGMSRNTVASSIKAFKDKMLISYRKDFNVYVISIDSSFSLKKDLSLKDIIESERTVDVTKNSNKYLHIDYKILHNNKLTLSEKFILAYISSFSKHNKDCFTKTEHICNMLRISVSAYIKALNNLRKLGLLESEITYKNNRISGKTMRIDLAQIDTLYSEQTNIKQVNTIESVEQVNTIEQVDTIEQVNAIEDIKNIEQVDTIEQVNNADIVSANIENVEQTNVEQANVEKVDNMHVYINTLSEEVLNTLSEEVLNKLYFTYKTQLEQIKKSKTNIHNNNQKEGEYK